MPNRTLCDVLNEMRKLNETRNYAPLDGLIEEAQIMGNRMESVLWDSKDHRRLKKAIKKLKAERDVLEDGK